jgi:hypothetical protein
MSDPFKQLRLAPAEEGTPAVPVRRFLRVPLGFLSRADSSSCDSTQANAVSDAASPSAAVTPLGAMLARHELRDGELVLLVLKPSFWFILLSSLRFIAVVLIFMLGAIAYEGRNNREWFYIEAAIFMVAGRIMFAVLQWMGRLYVLTDMRVIRLSGVFRLELFDCALRKVARTGVTVSVRERFCGTGSVEIVPAEGETCPPTTWQTVRRPHEVNDLITATINRAKQHGYGAAA